QQLPDGDSLLALLRELRPISGHVCLVVEPPTRVGDCKRHRGQALARRMDDDHRVLVPRLARLLVSNTAPEIDDFLAVVKHTARAAEFPASSEVLRKRVAHGGK